MQTLALDKNLFPKVRTGEKLLTIRHGARDIALGPLRITSTDGVSEIVVDVSSVAILDLWYVHLADILADGFSGRTDLLRGMRKFYPDITFDSTVTVVRWTAPGEAA